MDEITKWFVNQGLLGMIIVVLGYRYVRLEKKNDELLKTIDAEKDAHVQTIEKGHERQLDLYKEQSQIMVKNMEVLNKVTEALESHK